MLFTKIRMIYLGRIPFFDQPQTVKDANRITRSAGTPQIKGSLLFRLPSRLGEFILSDVGI